MATGTPVPPSPITLPAAASAPVSATEGELTFIGTATVLLRGTKPVPSWIKPAGKSDALRHHNANGEQDDDRRGESHRTSAEGP